MLGITKLYEWETFEVYEYIYCFYYFFNSKSLNLPNKNKYHEI